MIFSQLRISNLIKAIHSPVKYGSSSLNQLPILAFVSVFLFSTNILSQTTPTMGIRAKTPDARAFTNARIVVSPELVYDSGTLIIDDGKVVAVGDRVTIPADVLTIDLGGKTIYPGFIDPFTDYGLEKTEVTRHRNGRSSPQYEGNRIGGNAWNDAIHAEKNWGNLFKPEAEESREFIELGFTAVLTARKDGIFRGRSGVALLGEGLPNDLLIQPYSYHVASFDKGSSQQEYPSSIMGTIALVRQMFHDVDWYKKAHRAYRLHPNQKMPEFNTAIEALSLIHI